MHLVRVRVRARVRVRVRDRVRVRVRVRPPERTSRGERLAPWSTTTEAPARGAYLVGVEG